MFTADINSYGHIISPRNYTMPLSVICVQMLLVCFGENMTAVIFLFRQSDNTDNRAFPATLPLYRCNIRIAYGSRRQALYL